VNCTGAVLGTASSLATGGNGLYNYEWSTGDTTAEITGLLPGEYILEVRDQNLCFETDTIIIVQNTEVHINIQIDDPISCNKLADGKIRAVATDGVPPYIYTWTNGGPSTQVNENLREGDYSVTVNDHDGCAGQQSIYLPEPEPIIADFEVTNASCYGYSDGYVALNATGGTGNYYYYLNDSLISNDVATDLKAGNHPLYILDAENCETDTLVIVNQPNRIEIIKDEAATIYPFCPDWQNGVLSVAVKGGTREYIYNWAHSPTEQDSILEHIKEDSYTLTVTDAQNCIADTTFKLNALHDNCLGIPSAFTPLMDGFNDTWEIRYMTENGSEVNFNTVYPNGEISIFNRIGHLVYHCKGGCPQDWTGEDSNGKQLPVDTYYYIINLGTAEEKEPLKGIVTIIR
jgi:gliding motility-associated-like protein